MVAAEFGSNKRERNRRQGRRGGFFFGGGKTEDRKGGVERREGDLKAMPTSKSILWLERREIERTRADSDVLMYVHENEIIQNV